MSQRNDILINVLPHETRAAIIECGRLAELHVERTAHRGLVGNIYKGRVARVLPGIQAAFVDIGEGKNGFLHLRDLRFARQGSELAKKNTNELSIDQILHEGQPLLVQVKKDAFADKGPRLTTDLSLASRTLVCLPVSTEVSASRKIADRDQGSRMCAMVERLKAQTKADGGFIVRAAAQGASESDIANDMAFLRGQWAAIQVQAQQASSELVYQAPPLHLRLLREFKPSIAGSITIDDRNAFDQSCEFAANHFPELVPAIHFYEQPESLFKPIEQDIDAAIGRRVDLPSGAQLVIDRTEAMTVIDVNTASFVGANNSSQTILATNLEAAREIARQLRLRNAGGIVIIDFIDMAAKADRQTLLQTMQEAVEQDPAAIWLGRISRLGLLELSRERSHEGLIDLLCEPCSNCDSKSNAKTALTVCYEIVRKVYELDRLHKPKSYTVRASTEVATLLGDGEAAALTTLQNTLACQLSVQSDPQLDRHDYHIALA